jgi:hypothetical protein
VFHGARIAPGAGGVMMQNHYGCEKPEYEERTGASRRCFNQFSRIVTTLTITAALACGSLIARAETPDATLAMAVNPMELVWAARVCYLEATWRESDCVALLYVAKKRANRVGRSWLDVLREYSAINARNARATEVRAYPWGDVPQMPEGFNRRWQRLRDLVSEFVEGKQQDPCPRAEHWGGSMDHPRGRMIPARCAASTVNTFYAVKALKKPSSSK